MRPACAWVEYLATHYLADRTVASYASELELFIDFCADIGADAPVAGIDVVDEYFLRMSRRGRGGPKVTRIDSRTGLSRATLHHRATVIKLWFDYLTLRRLREDNPLAGRHVTYKGRKAGRTYLRKPDRTIWIPTESQVEALWRYLARYGTERDRFMMRLSYDAGLRVSELVAVDVAHFDWMHFTLRVPGGKGGKTRIVPFHPTLERSFERYVAWRSEIREGPGPLFVSHSNRNFGKRVLCGTWDDRIQEIRKALEMPLLRTHTMRHLICTDLARRGMTIDKIAAFAGHESYETTQLYIDLGQHDLVKEFSKGAGDVRAWRARQIAKWERP